MKLLSTLYVLLIARIHAHKEVAGLRGVESVNDGPVEGDQGEDQRRGLSCSDVAGWHDIDGDSYVCDWYALGNNCAVHGASYENMQHTANTACCACGGGSNTGVTASGVTPITMGCTGNGGACGCGYGGDGKLLSMNRFFGDGNDMKVDGCGGAFTLSSMDLSASWGGEMSETGPSASATQSVAAGFSQQPSHDGWEGKSMSDTLSPLLSLLASA
jgi:hypothetical protein